MRIIVAFTYEILFWVTIVSSLIYCPRLTAVVSRCSNPAPVYHRCPYLASDRPSCSHHPVIVSIYHWLHIFYITLRLLVGLVALPQEVVSKKARTKGPCSRRAKPSSSSSLGKYFK
jgi:hypothetical protein